MSAKKIHSKRFKIGKSTFQIQIYPGGNDDRDQNHVAVYLYNRSNWRVKAKGKFSVQNSDILFELEGTYFRDVSSDSRNSWGSNHFMSHVRCKRNDLLTGDGLLTLQVDVELLEEEVHAKRDLTQEETTVKLANLEHEVLDQKEQINSLQKSIKKMESKSQSQMNELKNMIRELAVSNRPPALQQQPPRIELECPVCMEVAKPPMRLKQCGKGHIICDSCHTKAEVEANSQWQAEETDRVGNPNIDLCHTCREVITGRPSELERILGLS
eukprot:GFUD01009232.1.p1 GENE.GFUD01009232.1~~GFUD01009232.1.p1  ORF type:complete len:269 (+),score=59.03 GFUD01009232.1:447-1253(+)